MAYQSVDSSDDATKEKEDGDDLERHANRSPAHVASAVETVGTVDAVGRVDFGWLEAWFAVNAVGEPRTKHFA